MLATVTNTTNTLDLPSRTINQYDTYTTLGVGPSVTVATGGAKKDGLPHPFGWVGVSQYQASGTNTGLVAGGTKQLPMHPRDWRFKRVPWLPMEAGEEWQQMIQKGTVSLSFASETGRTDSEELFLTAV